MAKWSREKVSPENLNGGNQYEAKDRLSREQLNAMVNSGLYSQDFAEHLADTPDTSQVDNVGVPSVEFINNIVDGKTYKKFKFSNLKGNKGDTGASAGFGTPTATVDSNVGTPSVTITASGSDTSKVFNFAFKNLKGEKGDKGDTGATGPQGETGPQGPRGESGLIYQSTGQNTDGAMSQKATTDELNTKANVDASNLSDTNASSWREKIGFGNFTESYLELSTNTTETLTTVDLGEYLNNTNGDKEFLVFMYFYANTPANAYGRLRAKTDLMEGGEGASHSNTFTLTYQFCDNSIVESGYTFVVPIKRYFYYKPSALSTLSIKTLGYWRIK